jgi:ribosomal protein L7/L12
MNTNIVINSQGHATITIETYVSGDNFKELMACVAKLTAPRLKDYQIEALEHLRQGSKLIAIKLWKENTGLGLKESKDAVEAFAAKELPKLYDEQGKIRK